MKLPKIKLPRKLKTTKTEKDPVSKPNFYTPITRKTSNRRRYLIKRIIITNALILLVLVLTYFWMVYLLSNVSSFWDIFRGKEIYAPKDTVAPLAPNIDSLPEAVKESPINISGRSEPGIKVYLYNNDVKVGDTITDGNGSFSFTDIQVGIFPQKFYVKSLDAANNESKQSEEYTVVLDNQPPEIKLTSPESDSTNHESTGHTFTISGVTDEGSTVFVNDILARVTPLGEFTATIRLEDGGNSVKIKAKDKAGNETEKEIFINFHKID